MRSSQNLKKILSNIENNSFLSEEERKFIIKELEVSIQELENNLDFNFLEIADSIYDGIYITDGEGKTIYTNAAYNRMTGIKREEIYGRYVSELSDKGLWKNAVAPEVVRTRKQVNSMAEAMRTGAKMLVTGNPIFDGNNNLKYVVVIDRDITDLLAMRAELEATKEKIRWCRGRW